MSAPARHVGARAPACAVVAAVLVAAVLVSALCAGCGAREPQAPPAEANRVASALSEIALACGEAHQQRAGGAPAPSAAVQTTADERTAELAHAYRRGPGRIYQGHTLREVIERTVGYLRECGLPGPAGELERATSVR